MDTTGLTNCLGCGVQPGSAHEDDCDHACCPGCGEQLLFHECDQEDGAEDRPAIWHGVDPQAEVARKRNWWTTASRIDHLVEDYTRVIFADGLGMVKWNWETQRYDIGNVDEAELDAALARSSARGW